jgi:hypothetical protein
MRHSIIVYTVSCILIGLDSASILYAGPIMRIEAFRPKAWEPLSKVSRLTPEERDSIRTKIDPFSFDYLKEPGWADQCAVAVIPLSEQREETRKDLVHLQRDEKGKLEEEPPDEKKRDEDELSKLLKRITGTLHVSFDFQTEPTDQPSIIQVQFRGRHVLLGGTSGKKTFSKSMELPVGVKGGKQTAIVVVRGLRTGIWEVSATAGVASAGPKSCAVPGVASLDDVTSR